MLTGIELITKEREDQIASGYDAHHDSFEVKEELAVAAGLYALDGTYADSMIWSAFDSPSQRDDYNKMWPWNDGSYPDKRGTVGNIKRLDRVRQLTIAGALIAAEIDRLQA